REILPEPVSREWESVSMVFWKRYLRAQKGSIRLQQLFESNNINSVLLRGMALCQYLYPDPFIRPMGDVDVLIDQEQIKQVLRLLESEGYRIKKKLRSQVVYEIESTIFEIHLSLLTPKRYKNAADTSLWFDTRIRFEVDGDSLYGLSYENELLELICHGFIHHGFDKPFQLLDIALLASREQIDWDYINAWAKKASLSKLVAFTFAYLEYLFQPRYNSIRQNLHNWNYFEGREDLFEAYSAVFFGPDCRNYLLKRKRCQFEIAENFSTKCREVLRLMSNKERNVMTSALLSGKLERKRK
ncbi:nucleotidyltransferase family protein, partial [bacterium]|nr:nucleotidyltransferase family protein [bacterium]